MGLHGEGHSRGILHRWWVTAFLMPCGCLVFFIFSIFFSELSLLEGFPDYQERSWGWATVCFLLYLSASAVSTSAILDWHCGNRDKCKKLQYFPHFPFCCILVFSTLVFLLAKCDCEQETWFLKFIEGNNAKCYWLQQFLSFKMFYSLSVQHRISFFWWWLSKLSVL